MKHLLRVQAERQVYLFSVTTRLFLVCEAQQNILDFALSVIFN